MRHRYQDTEFRERSRKRFRERYEDAEFREQRRKRMRDRYEDTEFRKQWSKRMRDKYQDTEYREQWRKHMREKYRQIEFRKRWSKYMRNKYQNIHFRQKCKENMKARYQDVSYRQQKQQKMREQMRSRYDSDITYRIKKRNKARVQMASYRQKVEHAEILKERVKVARLSRQSSVNKSAELLVAAFRKAIAAGPVYTCVSCHRHMYRQSVVIFNCTKYKVSMRLTTQSMLASFGRVVTDVPMYICKTCHSYLLRGRLPPQSAINGLLLEDVPEPLCLTELESVLISQRILFMRLMALPRGRQRCIHGAVVNVPSNVSSAVTVLPRTPGQAGLVALKLKRRLRYKGYVMHQFVRPDNVLQALEWLLDNNPLYTGISVDTQWKDSCLCEDDVTWNGITGGKSQQEAQKERDLCSDVEPDSSDSEATLSYDPQEEDTDVEPDSDSDADDALVQKVQGLKFSSCLQPCDPEYTAAELCVAPAEGQTPLDFMLDTNAEVLAFPTKFPHSTGGLTSERTVTLTPKKYFIQRLLNKDKRFASDANYLFYAQYVTEMKQIRDSVMIAMRQNAGRFSAGIVRDAEQLRQLMHHDQGYQFLKNVRGSPPYFKRAVKELIAMVAQIGCPQFFLTLSAADMSWPELFRIIGQQNGDILTDADIESLTYEQKASMLRNDPVLAARHFDHRLKAFFSTILVRGSVLGQIKTYFYRVEFQMRGSPHAHCLIWTTDGPDMQTSSSSDIVTYFDTKVTGQLPAESDDLHAIISRVQRHSHSVACKKKKQQSCRFHFPRPPSDRTMLAEPPSADDDIHSVQKWQSDILQRVQDALVEVDAESDTSLQDVLNSVSITSEDYHRALAINVKGRSLVLKRRLCDLFINNYNATILLAWQANMDIQPVLDPYACIMYMVSYITKDEREMGEILRAAKKEHADKDVRTQLKKVGSTFLTHRELSAQECVFRMLGLTMLSCTTKRVFVPTDLPEKRIRILKPSQELEVMDPESEDIYMSGIVQRYAARPAALDDMCLADFAVEYDVCYKSATNDKNDVVDDIQPVNGCDDKLYGNRITLSDRMGTMRHRKTRAILLAHKFSQQTEPESYYHAELMLYTPWRDEEHDLLADNATYAEAFGERENDIAAVKSQFYSHADALSDAIEAFVQHGPPASAWDSLAPQTRQDEIACAEEGATEETFVNCADDNILTTTFVSTSHIDASAIAPSAPAVELRQLSDNDFYTLTRSLNGGQQRVFQHVLEWCRLKRLSAKTRPFFVFCTGGAGVGKSRLIEAIVQMANRELRTAGDNPDEIIVHLAAPTGTAAYNIGGSTLHSSFLMNVTSRNKSDTLSADKLASLRNKFAKLQLLIIDELSMVGSNLLVRVHERLASIAGVPNSSPFADVIILAVGDLQQLPPVQETPVFKPPKSGYLALADLWGSNFQVCELTEVMRQQGDQQFAQLLSRLRIGEHTSDDIAVLRSREVSIDDVRYWSLPHVFAMNADVDAYNTQRLNSLPTASVTLHAKDKWPAICKDKSSADSEKKSGLVTALSVKVGARVMLIRNVDTEVGLFNGALGTVTGFLPADSCLPTNILVLFDNVRLQAMARSKYPSLAGSYPVELYEARYPIRHRNAFIEATRLQFPLKVAFAMTIHKCQGQTLDSVVVSLKGKFGPGQAYVAVSRCKSLASLYITDFNQKQLKPNKGGLIALHEMQQDQSLPVPHGDWLSSMCDANTMKLALLNTRSLQCHIDDILNSIYLEACNVSVFTEARLINSQSIPLQLSDKQVFAVNAPCEHNYVGGVAVVISRCKSACELLTVSHEKFQLIAVQVAFNEEFILIIAALYCSPSLCLSELRCNVQRYIESLVHDHSEPVIILDDFNIDARHSTVITGTRQHVRRPTHVNGSILDHVYCSGTLTTDVIACHWSDHNIVTVTATSDSIQRMSCEPLISVPEEVTAPCSRPTETLASTAAGASAKETSTSSSCSSSLREKKPVAPTSHSTATSTRNSSVTSTTTTNKRHTRNFTTACRFLDGALGPQRTQLTIDVPVTDFIEQNQLRIARVIGDGHCLLHSWSRSTGSSLAAIKQTVITEYLNNRQMYSNAGISEAELRRYLRCRDYNLNAVDAVLNMLCNAYHVTAYIIGNVHASSTVTLVQRISCVGNVEADATVLLLKTSDHYDSLF